MRNVPDTNPFEEDISQGYQRIAGIDLAQPTDRFWVRDARLINSTRNPGMQFVFLEGPNPSHPGNVLRAILSADMWPSIQKAYASGKTLLCVGTTVYAKSGD